MASSAAAASAKVLPLSGVLVLVVMGTAVGRRHAGGAPSLRRRHVGCGQRRGEGARTAAWRLSIAARRARARSVADALLAHDVVQHAASDIGPNSTAHTALG